MMRPPETPVPEGGTPCERVRELLSAYHDGELHGEKAALVAQHLPGCIDCSREYAAMQRLSTAVRGEFQPLTAPDILRSRVRAALREAAGSPTAQLDAPSRGVPRRTWWMGQVAAGVLIAVASSALTLAIARREPSADSMEHHVVEQHVRALMARHLTDVVSTNQHTVKPWFNGRVDFSPEVTLLDSAGFPLSGGRVDSLGGRAVAALVYGRRQHVIDVYTWPARRAGSPLEPVPMASERGYNTIHWSHHGMEFWAVSDLNPAELRQFVDAFNGGT